MQELTSTVHQNLDVRRHDSECLVQLAAHLAPADQALVSSVYERGVTATELARAIGTRPRTVRDRLQRLVQRINSPTFRYVLQERERWPAKRRRIAEAVFLRGEAQRKAAARVNSTIHEVRREVERIRAIAEAPLHT